MKRVLLISLSLVLALVGGSAACAEDGFYVIPSMKVVPKTGQTTSYGPGTDGALKKGVAWPTPRFTDNHNGTVTDNLTRLIWMKNASNVGADGFAIKTWADAISAANGLHTGQYGLTDGSNASEWRLPNVRELQSLIDYKFNNPALPNTLGTGQWAEGDPFRGVESSYYWTSTTNASGDTEAWFVYFGDGYVDFFNGEKSNSYYYVWCVRGGQ